MTIAALAGGLWGDRVGVKIESSATAGQIKLTAMYWTQAPPTQAGGAVTVDPTSRQPADLRSANRREPQLVEVYDNLDSNPLSTNFYEQQINGLSNLITVTRTAAGGPAPFVLTLLANGTDGNALALIDFEGNPADPPGHKRGLDAFTEIDEISLLCCPRLLCLESERDTPRREYQRHCDRSMRGAEEPLRHSQQCP